MTAIIPYVAEVLSFLGIMFSSIMGVIIAVISHRGAKHAKQGAQDAAQANDAVNHRHQDQPRLFDLAIQNHDISKELQEWKRSYRSSPWSDGHGVKRWLEDHEAEHKEFRKWMDEKDKTAGD